MGHSQNFTDTISIAQGVLFFTDTILGHEKWIVGPHGQADSHPHKEGESSFYSFGILVSDWRGLCTANVSWKQKSWKSSFVYEKLNTSSDENWKTKVLNST